MPNECPMPTNQEFDAETITGFLRRSYHAVDGLWFMKAEEMLGFDQALELDRRVWAVMAKIQARKARELLGATGNTLEELARCFALKLTAEGHVFTTDADAGGIHFRITRCPWMELLRKSDRQHLAQKISSVICGTEGVTWCAEFGGEYEFEIPSGPCPSSGPCELVFRSLPRGCAVH